jgi:hypothetical protein
MIAIPLPPALMQLRFTRDGRSGDLGTGPGVLRSNPDIGRGQSRARTTVIDDSFVLSTYMTELQYDLFVEFYKRKTAAGVIPVEFFDPDSRSIRTFTIVGTPAVSYPGAGYRYGWYTYVTINVIRHDQ